MKAVREVYGLRSSQDPDMRCVQAHVRATCLFMSDRRQEGMETTLGQIRYSLDDLNSSICAIRDSIR